MNDTPDSPQIPESAGGAPPFPDPDPDPVPIPTSPPSCVTIAWPCGDTGLPQVFTACGTMAPDDAIVEAYVQIGSVRVHGTPVAPIPSAGHWRVDFDMGATVGDGVIKAMILSPTDPASDMCDVGVAGGGGPDPGPCHDDVACRRAEAKADAVIANRRRSGVSAPPPSAKKPPPPAKRKTKAVPKKAAKKAKAIKKKATARKTPKKAKAVKKTTARPKAKKKKKR